MLRKEEWQGHPQNITSAMKCTRGSQSIALCPRERHGSLSTMTGSLFTTFRIVLRAPRDVCGKALTEKYINESRYLIFAERDNNLIRLLSFIFLAGEF